MLGRPLTHTIAKSGEQMKAMESPLPSFFTRPLTLSKMGSLQRDEAAPPPPSQSVQRRMRDHHLGLPFEINNYLLLSTTVRPEAPTRPLQDTTARPL